MTVFELRKSARELLEIERPGSGDLRTSIDDHSSRRGESLRVPFSTLRGAEDTSTRDPDVEERHDDEHREPNRWLSINLVICTITVWILFVACPVELAFATLMQDDLKMDDSEHRECSEYYVFQDYPEPGEAWPSISKSCNMLFAWTYVMQVAGSFSLVRTLTQALPIYSQNYWTVSYSRGGWFDRFISPARSYAFRTFFSGASFLLHVVSAVMLGVSPVINDKEPAAEEYQIMFRLCLALICVCTVATLQQTVATALAAWRLRGWKKNPSSATMI